MAKMLNTEMVLRLMRARQGDRTSKEFAAELGISQAYLSDVYGGRREIGPTLLKALGLEREPSYRIVEKSA